MKSLPISTHPFALRRAVPLSHRPCAPQRRAALKGNWPVNQNFDLFGKVGYYFWDADIDLSGDSGQVRNSSGSDLSWGLGAGYNFTDNISIVAEWRWFQSEEADADMMSASVVWKF